jgi:hypothetical protein
VPFDLGLLYNFDVPISTVALSIDIFAKVKMLPIAQLCNQVCTSVKGIA